MAQWAPSDAFSVPGESRGSRRPRRGRADSSSSTETAQRLLTSQLSNVGSARELLEILDVELDSPIVNKLHIGAAFTRLARHKSTFDRTLQQSLVVVRLVSKTTEMMDGGLLSTRQVANVLWAIASMGEIGVSLHALLPALIDNALINVKDLDPQHVSNIIWAAATLQLPDAELKRLLPSICSRVPELATEFTPQAIANMIWASATLKDRAQALLEVLPWLLEQVPRVAKELKSQGVSNILWAGATLREEHSTLWHRVMPHLRQAAVAKLHTGAPQEVANSVWALALLDPSQQEASETLERLSVVATSLADRMTAQGLANTCFGFALRSVACPAFLDAAARSVIAQVHTWPSSARTMGLPEIVWAFAKLGIVNKQLLTVADRAFQGILSDMSVWRLCVVVSDSNMLLSICFF